MSSETDRIPVPTNGRRPHAAKQSKAESAATAETHTDPVSETLREAAAAVPTSADFSVAFTPKQIAVGFGVLASLLLIIAGVRKRRPGA